MFDFLNTWLSSGGWWVAVLLVVAGFALLLFGADWLVNGASGLAKRFGVRDLVIGLTVVAFGTSMPEFVVNMVAVSQHNSEIAITNILGSNIVNVFFILGCSALIYPIASTRQSRRFDIPWSMFAALVVLLFATYNSPAWIHIENIFNMHIDGVRWSDLGEFHWGDGNHAFISGVGGFVLLVFFGIFLCHSIRNAKNGTTEENYNSMKLYKALLLIATGLLSLVVGGEMIVKSATAIARQAGVSDALIGLTIVAVGTSLPELATSCVAAYKKNSDIALGNVIGSNIFNIFFILGMSAVIYPLPGYPGLELDALMAALASAMVMLFVYTNRNHAIKRWHGAILLLTYAAYLTFRLMTA